MEADAADATLAAERSVDTRSNGNILGATALRSAHPMPSLTRAAALFVLLTVATAAPAAPYAYITNQADHTVTVIDVATDRAVATVPVDKSPAGVVAVSAAGKVFVTAPDSHAVSVIDMATQSRIATLPAGQGAVGIDAAPDGQRVYVADWFGQHLLGFDTGGTHAEVLRVKLGRAPAGVAVSPDGRHVYVAERDDNVVAVVDVAAAAVVARVPTGEHPFALLVDAPRGRLYALNVYSDDVSVIDVRDPARPQRAGTVKVGKAPYGAALAAGGRRLYVTNQRDDSVSVVDPDTLALVQTLRGFGYPEGIASVGDRVLVVNWMDENVSVLDAASGRELKRVDTGRNPRGFGAFIGAPGPR